MVEQTRGPRPAGVVTVATLLLLMLLAPVQAGPRRHLRSHWPAGGCCQPGLSAGCCPQIPQCGALPGGKTPLPVGPAPVVSLPAPPPRPEIVQLGYSVLGVPITMHVFGQRGRMTLIFGAIHGDESNSGHLARQLLDHLLQHPDAYSECRVAVIPVANPDGLVRTRRLNEHRIDLNRNFPASNWKVGPAGSYFGGQQAASEPETQAIIKAVELVQPDRIVSIHAITRGRECNNYDGPGAELAEVMKAKNGYRVAKSIGYPTPGSFGSWAGIDRQIPTITLELPVDLPGAECWQQQREALLAVIQFGKAGAESPPAARPN